MTGLEKMISQIVDEAEAEAKGREEAARAEAEKIASEAKAEAEKLSADILAQSEADAANYLERIKSSADLQRRTRILRAKQEVISSVMEKAYESLSELDTEAYFALIRKMLEKYVLSENGEIYFSAGDLERLPAGFEKEISAIAAKKGGSLTLQKDGRAIENGFILVYGGIEENCTFRALFNTQRDDLQDKIHQELFA